MSKNLRKWMLMCMCCLAIALSIGGNTITAEAAQTTTGQTTVFADYNQATNYIRQQFVARNTDFKVYLTLDLYSKVSEMVNDSMNYSESCSGQEGDALAYSLLRGGYSYGYDGANYYLSLQFTFRTNKSQEDELTAAVNKAMAQLNLSGKDEYAKAKAIYDYICTHVSYDYTGLANGDAYAHTAYKAMTKGTAVCQGYATLFYRMAKEAGLSVRIISGNTATGSHAWNIVKVNGKYYIVDCTWGSTNATTQSLYFLLGQLEYGDAIANAQFLTEEFTSQYPISLNKYGYTVQKINKDNPVINYTDTNGQTKSSAANGKAKLVVLYGHLCPNSKNLVRALSSLLKDGYEFDVTAFEVQSGTMADVNSFVSETGADSRISFNNPENEVYAYYYYNQFMKANGLSAGILPMVFYVDSNNKIQGYFSGSESSAQIKTYLKEYLDVTEPVKKQALAITEQPANITAMTGDTITFSVKAVGEGVTYQWQYKNANATTWSNSGAAAAKTANMTFKVGTEKSLNGRQYRCIVKSNQGETLTSAAATLTVKAALAITSQPTDQTAEVRKVVTFSVKATGDGLTYQWQYKNASATTWSNSNTTAAKTANMKFTVGTDKALDGREYRCIIKDAYGNQVTSNVARLNVYTALAITSQPVDLTAKVGDAVTFSVQATGMNLTYQWQYKNATATTWSNSGIAAAKTANMKFNVGTDKNLNGRQYRCIVTDETGASITSAAATLTVGSEVKFAITSQPADVTASTGTKVTFSVQATGSGLTYQWQYKNAGASTWNNSGIAAAKTANMTFSVGTDKNLNGRQYRCVVKDANNNVLESNAATLTVQ